MTPHWVPKTALAASLALALAACNTLDGDPQSGLVEPDPAGLTNQISGVIASWGAQGTATIEAQEQPAGADRSAYLTLSQGTVNANGSFSLTLPTAAAVAPYLDRFLQTPRPNCTGFFTQSVPDARHYVVNDYALRRADGSYIGFLVQDNPGKGNTLKAGDYFIERIYADQAHTVTGSLACATFKITITLNLKPGWNAMVDTVNAVNAEGQITQYTLSTVATLPASTF
jgi:hypothetical protein